MSQRRLRTLADRDAQPRHGLTVSQRPAHVVIVVCDNDIESALRLLRKQRGEVGLARLMKRTSMLFAAQTRGQKRRAKTGRHRSIMRRAAAKRASWEATLEEEKAIRRHARRRGGDRAAAA